MWISFAGAARSRSTSPLMAIYPPGEQWTGSIPAAAFFNGPVIDVIDGLERVLRQHAIPHRDKQ